ncbi:hypothetical protein KEM56_001600 [Ascosphaera pollenicola]|nr:hypothetical protein KEM56_001600 [Ascosphaera pollenicola]
MTWSTTTTSAADKQISEVLAKTSRLEQAQLALEKRLAELDARSKLPPRPASLSPPQQQQQQQIQQQQSSTTATDSTIRPSPVPSSATTPTTSVTVPDHVATALKAVQSDIRTLDTRYNGLQSSAEEKDRIFADTFEEVTSRVEALQKNITELRHDIAAVKKDVEGVNERASKHEKDLERVEREAKDRERNALAREKAGRLEIQTQQIQNQNQNLNQNQQFATATATPVPVPHSKNFDFS